MKAVHWVFFVLFHWQGSTCSAMSYLLGRWAPPDERCSLYAITHIGEPRPLLLNLYNETYFRFNHCVVICLSVFGHVVRLPPTVPCNAILRITREISMGRRISPGWRRPRGRPRASWRSQLKRDTGVPTATSWRPAVDRQLCREDATAVNGYATWWWWWWWSYVRFTFIYTRRMYRPVAWCVEKDSYSR